VAVVVTLTRYRSNAVSAAKLRELSRYSLSIVLIALPSPPSSRKPCRLAAASSVAGGCSSRREPSSDSKAIQCFWRALVCTARLRRRQGLQRGTRAHAPATDLRRVIYASRKFRSTTLQTWQQEYSDRYVGLRISPCQQVEPANPWKRAAHHQRANMSVAPATMPPVVSE
jgi:hypothetical protein